MPDLATDKTMFWTAADIEARWKDNEANKRINSRIYNGPANISANVRIVLPNDPPLTHVETADLWLVMEGEAVARTDGEIVQANGDDTIRNGVARPDAPGRPPLRAARRASPLHGHEGIQSLADPI